MTAFAPSNSIVKKEQFIEATCVKQYVCGVIQAWQEYFVERTCWTVLSKIT